MKPMYERPNRTVLIISFIFTVILPCIMTGACAVPDTAPPVPGDGGKLTDTTDFLYWEAATDDTTPSSELEYMVYTSFLISNLDTIEECKAHAEQYLADWEVNLTMTSISGVSAVPYYFTVIVRDAAGNESKYRVSDPVYF
jgi:hypothetical protein